MPAVKRGRKRGRKEGRKYKSRRCGQSKERKERRRKRKKEEEGGINGAGASSDVNVLGGGK